MLLLLTVAALGQHPFRTGLLTIGMPGSTQGIHDNQAGDKNFKLHLDAYNMLPAWQGKVKEHPRKEIFYFDAGGNLNARRYNDWKLHFAIMEG